MAAEIEKLRRMRAPQVDAYLLSEFGPGALKPIGDTDRPLSADELRELGSSPWVEIGNHTIDHAVLTKCSPEDAADQVRQAQRWLSELLGAPPFVIAYPDGAHDPAIVEMCRDEGLRLGVTTTPENNRLPLDQGSRMRLGRFRITFGHRERPQMRAVCSTVQLAAAGRRLALRGR
jgi:peptidoglycan/xylan/chitin deacetylase (PgdA/CDA1 family)